MPKPTIDLGQISCVAGMRLQMLSGAEQLAHALQARHPNARGYAYQVCLAWQQRFETAFQSPIPTWRGLVGFRGGVDWNVSEPFLEKLQEAAQLEALDTDSTSPPKLLNTLAECWRAYVAYLEKNQDFFSGKFTLLSPTVQNWFSANRLDCEPVLGGQAGNIVSVWHSIGAEAVLYTPYLSDSFTNLSAVHPALGDLNILRIEQGEIGLEELRRLDPQSGLVNSQGTRDPAPTLASWTAVAQGRRLIYSLPASRVLNTKQDDSFTPSRVQFFYEGRPLLNFPLTQPANSAGWAALPFFRECRVNAEQAQLEVTLVSPEKLGAALKGKIQFVIIGGIESLFYDEWLTQAPPLQARLLHLLEQQLRAIHDAGMRIGIELSGIPHRTYAEFVRRLSQQGVIQVIGINGADELPEVVGSSSLHAQLFDLWLDPASLPAPFETLAAHHADYLTFLQAHKLAEWTDIPTLYVHTLGLDFILKRHTEPGALARAQQGDMMSKGLVIAALLERAYGSEWNKQLKYIPPAVKPSAMAQLARFADDFEMFEHSAGAARQLLEQGYWLATLPEAHSLTVVPVMWPSVGDERASASLPDRLNPTGAGDMTFGAFFLLGGV